MENTNRNRGPAAFIARWILGVLFLVAGYWKVFTLTATQHAQKFFVEGFADTWIPEWLLWSLGLSIPYLELLAGVLLVVGFRIRETLIALGCLLILTTYGHALQEPLFDIDGHTFTRLVLILFLLVHGWSEDRATVDWWLLRRSKE